MDSAITWIVTKLAKEYFEEVLGEQNFKSGFLHGCEIKNIKLNARKLNEKLIQMDAPFRIETASVGLLHIKPIIMPPGLEILMDDLEFACNYVGKRGVLLGDYRKKFLEKKKLEDEKKKLIPININSVSMGHNDWIIINQNNVKKLELKPNETIPLPKKFKQASKFDNYQPMIVPPTIEEQKKILHNRGVILNSSSLNNSQVPIIQNPIVQNQIIDPKTIFMDAIKQYDNTQSKNALQQSITSYSDKNRTFTPVPIAAVFNMPVTPVHSLQTSKIGYVNNCIPAQINPYPQYTVQGIKNIQAIQGVQGFPNIPNISHIQNVYKA